MQVNGTMFLNFYYEYGSRGVWELLDILNGHRGGAINLAARHFVKKASWMSLFVKSCVSRTYYLPADLQQLMEIQNDIDRAKAARARLECARITQLSRGSNRQVAREARQTL